MCNSATRRQVKKTSDIPHGCRRRHRPSGCRCRCRGPLVPFIVPLSSSRAAREASCSGQECVRPCIPDIHTIVTQISRFPRRPPSHLGNVRFGCHHKFGWLPPNISPPLLAADRSNCLSQPPFLASRAYLFFLKNYPFSKLMTLVCYVQQGKSNFPFLYRCQPAGAGLRPQPRSAKVALALARLPDLGLTPSASQNGLGFVI